MKSSSQIFRVKRIEAETEINQLEKTEAKVQEKPLETIRYRKKNFLRLKRNLHYDSENAEISNGRWNNREHRIFLENSIVLGNDWKKIHELIKTRTTAQIRSHAQKFIIKLCKKYNIKLSLKRKKKIEIKQLRIKNKLMLNKFRRIIDFIDEMHKEIVFLFIFFFQMNHLQFLFKEDLFESEAQRNFYLASLISLESLFDLQFIEKPQRLSYYSEKIQLQKYYEINKQMIMKNFNNTKINENSIEKTTLNKMDLEFNYEEADDFFIEINSDYDPAEELNYLKSKKEKDSGIDFLNFNCDYNGFNLVDNKQIDQNLFNEKLEEIKEKYKKLSSDFTKDDSKILKLNHDNNNISNNISDLNSEEKFLLKDKCIFNNKNYKNNNTENNNELRLKYFLEKAGNHYSFTKEFNILNTNKNINNTNIPTTNNIKNYFNIIEENAKPFKLFKQNMLLFNAMEAKLLNFNSKLNLIKNNYEKLINQQQQSNCSHTNNKDNNNLNNFINDQNTIVNSECNYNYMIKSYLDIYFHMNQIIHYFQFFFKEFLNSDKILNFLLLNNKVFNFLDFESVNIDYFFNNKEILIEEFKKFMY